MSDFIFTKKPHTTMVDVWYQSILIGELGCKIEDRHTCTYMAYCNERLSCIGSFDSFEEAAQAILDEHRKLFNQRITVEDPCQEKLKTMTRNVTVGHTT